MKVSIGTYEGKPFQIDVGVLADTRALICASSGGGKSWLLRVLAEQVSDKVQTIIIDPEGEFSSLREKLDILIVGENGDIKPDIKSAGLLARRLAETGISAVIDIYDLPGAGDPWEKRRLFVYAFLTGLMNIPKSMYHPMLVAIDEAHNFATESPSKGGKELAQRLFKKNESPSLLSRSAVRNLMSAGRKRGIGGLLATQRISKIDKDSIADARTIFIGGTNLDIDQERAGDMLGMTKRESVSLRDLEAGEFHCFGSAIGKRGVFRFRSATVKTTHPRAGQRLNMEVPKASTQIAKIAAQFGDLPAEVDGEEKNLLTLQTENERLKRELSARPVQVKPEKHIERIEVPIIKDEQVKALETYAFMMNGNAGALIDSAEKARQAAQDITAAITKHKSAPTPVLPTPRKPAPVRNALPPQPKDDISNPEQRILNAIAWFESIGIYEPRQEAVAFLAGYTYGGGAFNNPRGRLNTRGFVSYKGKCIALTDTGRQYADQPDSPLTEADLHQQVLSVLPKPHRAIMEALLPYRHTPISKEQLSEMVGRRGGAFNNPLGRLRSMGMIDYPERGTVAVQSFLFME
jgi:hypothetical protein